MHKPVTIPFHRHVEIGRQLHDTIDLLWAIRRELNESKRHPNARQAANEAMHAIKRLDILRSELENLLCTSGCMDEESITCNPCNVYYGPFKDADK